MNSCCRSDLPAALFTVLAKDGHVMMQTNDPACIPSPEDQKAMKAAGYNRYTVVGKHNYGRFHYYNDGAIISDTAIVDGLHDAFSCPMCGCQIVVHPHLPIYEERQADTDAPTSEI